MAAFTPGCPGSLLMMTTGKGSSLLPPPSSLLPLPRDITLGRRIGFYKIKGELGSGNFSRVRLASHGLSQGEGGNGNFPTLADRSVTSVDRGLGIKH